MSEQTYPVEITARHMDLTDSIRDYCRSKLERIHMEYPRIIDAKVVLDQQQHGHIAEIIRYCANNVTIEADTETRDLYEAIDLTIDKIGRQMRKEKTRQHKRATGH